MRRSLTNVMDVPSAVYLMASVASVAVKGTYGIGGITILSRTSRTPPSCEAGPERRISGVCARQAKLVNQRIPTTQIRIIPPPPCVGMLRQSRDRDTGRGRV